MGFQSDEGSHNKRHNHIKHLLNGGHIAFHASSCLIIRDPASRVLSLLVRPTLLALLILSFTWLSSSKFGLASAVANTASVVFADSDTIDLELLPLLFLDLKNEGLLKLSDKALFVCGEDDVALQTSQALAGNMFMVSVTNEAEQSSIPTGTFDFAFTRSFDISMEFIDRALKNGGIIAIQLNQNPTLTFKKPQNYQTIYVRQLRSKVLVMRKVEYAGKRNAFARRKLLASADEAKKKALNKLEDVLLEPPRAASRKSRTYQKRTRYLPDLMGDSLDLESYPRRVFIDVGLPEKEGGSRTDWFAMNYPTRNLEFEMYKIETVTEELSGKEVVPQMGMSDWLKENVKEEEYVVMKAEAEVVEEMVKNKAIIRLVDELFLECKPKGLELGGRKGLMNHNSGRAYWECLALYGKLRDEGVAVHQWWG